MDELLREFEILLNQTSEMGLGGSIDLLLLQMEGDKAEQLKLCAIPHQFDSDILQVLVPGLDGAEAKKLYDEFINLSIVISFENEAAMHDEARSHLFAQWLKPSSEAKFLQANKSLVLYYEKCLAGSEGINRENFERQRMYHLLGVDQAEGFIEFERLFGEMWHQYRISECESLLNLMHQYDSVISTELSLWLKYYEGKIATGHRQWNRAESLLKDVVKKECLPSTLHVKAKHRMGMVHAEQRNWNNAIEIFQQVLELVKSSEEHSDLVDEILHEIGCAHRDSGELTLSENFLMESLKIATEKNDFDSIALVYNSLGSLHQKLGKPQTAIEMYEKSLNILIENKERFRSAQVYNNLGMAFADLREWEKSEDFLRKSLEIKRQAGDTHGQATTLTNLVRVYINLKLPQQAIEASYKAINLFKEVKDNYTIARVKRNLGKLYRCINNPELARNAFGDAIELFKQLNEFELAENTEVECSSLEDHNKGLPWWAWMAFIFLILIILVIIYAILR